MLVTSEEVFNQEIASTPLVVVKFSAEWCGPCKMLAPIVEELAGEYTDRVKFLNVDIDTTPEIAPRFGIRGVPTVVIFKDGQVANTVVGLQPKGRLQLAIDTALA